MTLYLIGTPIGNLGDMTPRAVAVLKTVPVLAVEKWTDTIKRSGPTRLNYLSILILGKKQLSITTTRIVDEWLPRF
ncbi:MAG: SAM-dependent methyltransferase [Candidatus Vogelbacteria bacterium]|nr:SAM-dependent methyltransferase [Candidatus Vogelbacteria bacterium]